MTTTDLAAPYATLVSQANPSTAYYFKKLGYLSLSGVAGSQFESVVWFANPFPRGGANVASAKLVLKTRALGAGATISARLADKWPSSFGGLTWNNKPTVSSATASLTKSGAQPANAVWELDVTALMQQVASGQGFYGFVLTTTSTGLVQVQSPAMGRNLAPHLVVDWSVAPLAPTSLAPAGGRVVANPKPTLRFDFRDTVGATNIAAVQVQTNSANSFTAPAFDSGIVAATTEQLDLTTTAFTAPTVGATTWWRVRVQDGSGLWSPWSASASWVYRPNPTVTITAPASGTVNDPTPPIAWTVTGSTQTASRAMLQSQTSSGWKMISDSGWRVGTDTSWTPTQPMSITGLQRITVQVRDQYARETVPGFPTYGQAVRDVTFAPGPVSGVTGLTATQALGGLVLSWARSQTPDEWTIYRDDKLVVRVSGLSLLKGSTTFSFTDALAPGGTHTWKVFAIVNKVAGPAGSVKATTVRKGIVLADPDDLSQSVVVMGRGIEQGMPEVGTTFEPIGARTAVRVVSAQRGWEGAVVGTLSDPTMAATWRNRLLDWKPQLGKVLWMVAWDQTFRVLISEVYVGGNEQDGGGHVWSVGFSYRQVDDFTFDALGG